MGQGAQASSASQEQQPFLGKAALITLGCAKNQVDSEVMAGVLSRAGFELTDDAADADVAVVNTCGFLQSAVKESIDCILNVSRYKQEGRLRRLVVAGCMVQRYQGDLGSALPEVDQFIGVDELLSVDKAVSGGLPEGLIAAARPYFLYDETLPRRLSTRSHTAWVKVSEGCDRPCTFCIIPRLRGGMRSRSIDSVLREAEQLASQGVKEINLIAQDLTAFGSDRKEHGALVSLLRALDAQKAIPWIRLLYAYPLGTDRALLDAIMELPSLCKYLDIPLQHVSEPVLKAMKRPLGKCTPRNIMELLSKEYPEIAVRTTFITGFPGETADDVAELESFISAGYFASVGVFTYSREEGTPSAELDGQIGDKEKARRREQLMLAQQEVVGRRLAPFVGRRIEVMVEGAHEETELLLSGRARFQAPEVDGSVIINDCTGETPSPGDIGTMEITEVAGYDLVGRYCGRSGEARV
jgi:ribosomal protein S12 methylthiotransferase